MKNLVQQRHLRRLCVRLIVSLITQKDCGGRKLRRIPEEDETGRRKKRFRVKGWKKTLRKKTEVQTARFRPLSFRR